MMVVDMVRKPHEDEHDVGHVGKLIESSRSFSTPHMGYVAPTRKLIAAPRFDPSFDDDDDDDLSDIPPSSPQLPVSLSTHTHASLHGSPTSSDGFSTSGSPVRKHGTRSPISRTAYDLIQYGANGITSRRHSISICETPLDTSRRNSLDRQSSTTSTCSNRTSVSCNSPSSQQGPFYESSSKMQRDFLKSSHFSHRLDCLSLTLEEVVHIRNVLTKAELEALPLDKSIKQDVTRGKICFLCMKTRFGFGFFSQRGRDCRLCKRTVCKKCMTKMRIPTEHFSTIPVVMLTPNAISPREEEESSIPRSFLNMLQDIPLPGNLGADRSSNVSGSVGSAPSSPKSSRSREGGPSSLPSPPVPAPCVASDIKKKQELRQRQQEMESRLRGELMSVCLDCKAMVIHVLYSIKLRRDYPHTHSPNCAKTDEIDGSCTNSNELRNHLHLELTSVYD